MSKIPASLINERDEHAAKLEFLRSKGLTVGMMQESGKDPYLAYAIEPGSELCDLKTVNKLVDAEIRADKAIELLKRCYNAGHREGWQDGESNAECSAAVNDFLLNTIGNDWGGKMELAELAAELPADDTTESERAELAVKRPKRTDSEGRDVTDLPGLWSEDDSYTVIPYVTNSRKIDMALTLDELIERSLQLRDVLGRGDVDVGRLIDVNGEQCWEAAAIEIQNVLPESDIVNEVETWRCGDGMVNTKQIISVF